MIVYRLVRKDRISLDGKGAALYPGRWNEENIPCLYTSVSPSLSQLEVMANADDWKIFMKVPYMMLHIEIPEKKVKNISKQELPVDWDAAVHSLETQTFGTLLLNDFKLLAFSVPSILSKLEQNIIINPRAVDFVMVKIVATSDFEFDRRLMR